MKYIPYILTFASALFMILTCSSCNNEKASASANTTASAVAEPYTGGGVPLIIGTYTRDMGFVNGQASGIHLAYLKEGKVYYSKSIEAGPNPSYVAKHPRSNFIYAVNEVGGSAEEPLGSIVALKFDSLMNFEIINSRTCEGASPCHISINKYGTHAMLANYSSGSIATFPIGLDGMTGRNNDGIKYAGTGPNKSSQNGPHAHFFAEGPDKLVYAADLGTDQVHVYSMNGGHLTPHPHQIKVSSGAGPRHIAFHKSQPILYILNELNGTIEVWKSGAGPYQKIQTIGTLSGGTKGNSSSAAIKITPNGQFLFASNRGNHNSIASYAIESNGQLKYITNTKTLGKAPRDFEIDPTGNYLIIANQDSNNIVTYKLNQRNGALTAPVVSEGIMTPVCIAFL